jgi:hypothetical protein
VQLINTEATNLFYCGVKEPCLDSDIGSTAPSCGVIHTDFEKDSFVLR